MNWTVPRMWEGADVWILGGGPSVTKQFGIPEEVVQNVKTRTSPLSVYSPYMKAIHNKPVIGINVAYQIGTWIDMMFWGDVNIWLWYQEDLSKWPGLKVTCREQDGDQKWVKLLLKDTEHVRGISRFPNMVSWNYNSGAAAISIAAWAGAKRIFLLGFDMTLGSDKKMHFHDQYKRGTIEAEKEVVKWTSVFERQLKGFFYIAEDAKRLGIEIINVNPDSAIQDFPKCNLKDIL